jgi:hypothetical protein
MSVFYPLFFLLHTTAGGIGGGNFSQARGTDF